MHIEVLNVPVGTLVAREQNFATPEGEFHFEPDGRIGYRHPSEPLQWTAGETLAQFVVAAQAWNDYTVAVRGPAEPEQRLIVLILRQRLTTIGVAANPASIWNVLLEQAEAGLL